MRLCGFDLETPQDIPAYGLQPWRARTGEATIKSVAIWESDQVCGYKKMPSKEWFQKFLVHAAANKIALVTWNGLFDISWLHAIGLTEEVNAVTWIDAMLLLKRIDGWRNKDLNKRGKGYRLKDVVAERWPEHADYGLGDDVTKVPQTEEEWTTLLEYNLKDSRFTCLLGREYLEMLTEAERKAARHEALGLSPIALSAINGLCINSTALNALEADVAVRREKAEAVLGVSSEIIASPAKLGELLFDTWGLTSVKTTPAGKASTDKESLLTLELAYPDDKRLGALMAMRKVNTQQSKFVDAVRKSVEYHGELVSRPWPFIAGTYTGRMTYASKQGKNKDTLQTGIALHQWERGKQTRNILEAPEGFLIAEFDASGQEMRLMAEASQDEMMLKLFSDGIDGHAYMGGAIENLDWEWIRDTQDSDPKAKAARNLGKFCIAEGELVLTDTGLVPIENVSVDMLVWDGVEWVHHDGLLPMGEKEVMTYDGLTATTDHIVFLQDGSPCEFREASDKGYKIASTGDGRQAIRLKDDSLHSHISERKVSVCEDEVLMRSTGVGGSVEPSIRQVGWLSSVCRREEKDICKLWSSWKAFRRNREPLQCSDESILQKLWGAWNQMLVCLSAGLYSVCGSLSAAQRLCWSGNRQDRQQWPLRGGESEACIAERKHVEHESELLFDLQGGTNSSKSGLSRSSKCVAECDVYAVCRAEPGITRAVSGGDCRSLSKPSELQTKRTYDIANAGPRHRFTVSGRLVSNCNLSLQYRIGINTIRVRALTQYGLNLPLSKAEHIKSTYVRTYKGVPKYWKSAVRLAGELGYAETKGHRRIALLNLNAYEQQQTAINFPIQGTGGDMKELAIAALRPEFNDDVLYAWDLHDALFLYVRDDDRAVETVKRIRSKLDSLPYQMAWGWTPAIPLPWDAKLGKSWGTLKGVEK